MSDGWFYNATRSRNLPALDLAPRCICITAQQYDPECEIHGPKQASVGYLPDSEGQDKHV